MFPRRMTFKALNSLPVKAWMNTKYMVIHPDDSLRTVVRIYKDMKMDTLPVVDNDGKLVGVFPRRSLYTALLEDISLDEQCTPYIVFSPLVNYAEQVYNQVTMVEKANKSPVGNVPVLDPEGKVVGMLGKLEYLRQTLDLTVESHALLESIFQAMHEGLIVVDHEGYILRVNQSAERMFGVSYADLQDKYIEDIFPEINFSKCNFKQRACIRFRCTIRSVCVIISMVPILENEEQIGINIAFQDVSDFEKIAQELEITKDLQTTLKGVLNASADGVFVIGKSGSIKYVNEMASQLLEIPTEGITGRPLREILPLNGHSRVADTALAEVDVCLINGKSCIVSHVPIKAHINDHKSVGVVSTVYCSENKLTEEIVRKWFSLRQQVQYYRDELEKRGVEQGSFDLIVSSNNEFIKKKKEAQRIARSSSTVLLTGESGVGKDMFARAIHAASPRAKLPFVKVNCAAIPETLLESELFGYASGSFTGASKKGKPGYFEQAHKGTIFLDEIGDMPLSIQVKILQVIQDKQFMLVGGTNPQKVDVRIIAATNRDLREAIARGTFREDLYYRLNVIELHLPPLRFRSEDILPLAEMFIEKYNHILGANVIGITPEAREALAMYDWPGNIRELENAIERAANYIWEGQIGTEHLPSHILHSDQDDVKPLSYQAVLQDLDKEMIVDTLKRADGNKSAAAKMLNMSRSGFYKKLTRHGL